MWRIARTALNWGLALTMMAAQACTPYAHGYAYTTRQTSAAAVGTVTAPASPLRNTSTAPAGEVLPSATPAELSKQLTNYFENHRLPMVGAQIGIASDGDRQVILYGFVATPFGKQDAEDKARRFLGDPAVRIDNRIVVRPELIAANAGSGTSASTSSATTTSPGNSNSNLQTYQNQNTQIQQYQQQQQRMQADSLLAALIPLLGMAIIAGTPYGSVGGGYYPSYPGPSYNPSMPPPGAPSYLYPSYPYP